MEIDLGQVFVWGEGEKKKCVHVSSGILSVTSCANLLNGKLKRNYFSKLQKYFIPRFFPFFLRFNFQDIGQIREITLQTRGIRLNLI